MVQVIADAVGQKVSEVNEYAIGFFIVHRSFVIALRTAEAGANDK
jgi:hypothetical protein